MSFQAKRTEFTTGDNLRNRSSIDAVLPAANQHPLMPVAETFTLCGLMSDEPLRIQRCLASDYERQEVSDFISSVYYAVHHAVLKAFMPELFSIRDSSYQLVAAVGLRPIQDEPIFLEQYLTCQVEKCIRPFAGRDVPRQSIAEVGNLASISAGSGRNLIAFLVHYMAENQIDWAVFTGTNAVRGALTRMGITYHMIEKADPERLGEDRLLWGNYYNNSPFVLGVNIQLAHQVLKDKYHYGRCPL
ncbi:thermostable hemolysin [Porticoccaceae bacterium LTM1]|nr:thermostable hemolysin [Porticoccaceae bacterium LTM1]